MSPDANTGNLIWEMLVLTGTLVILFLFAFEVIRGRRLAKAKQVAAKRWSEDHTLTLGKPESQKPTAAPGNPWAPRGTNKAY
jgi:hypothetical protein